MDVVLSKMLRLESPNERGYQQEFSYPTEIGVFWLTNFLGPVACADLNISPSNKPGPELLKLLIT